MAKMETVSVSAYAKVNFTLDILGVRAGYHLLDSLVCTVDLCDEVTALCARRRHSARRSERAGRRSSSTAAFPSARVWAALLPMRPAC